MKDRMIRKALPGSRPASDIVDRKIDRVNAKCKGNLPPEMRILVPLEKKQLRYVVWSFRVLFHSAEDLLHEVVVMISPARCLSVPSLAGERPPRSEQIVVAPLPSPRLQSWMRPGPPSS